MITDEEHITMLRATLRAFMDAHVPYRLAQEWDSGEADLGRDFIKELAKLELLGVTIPEEYGGSGIDLMACLVTMEELSTRSSGAATIYQMGPLFAGMNLRAAATEAQQRSLLPLIPTGDLLFSLGYSEPDVGADLASVKTRAYRDGQTVVINGTKRWCTGAAKSDFIYTLCKTDPSGTRYHDLSLILIPPTASGVHLQEMKTMGNHGPGTFDVTLVDVVVPAANIVGGEERWNGAWPLLVGPGLDFERVGAAVVALGTARGAVARAWSYSQEREQFGKPICALQSIRHMLADAQTKLEACRLMAYQAANMVAAHQPAAVETSMAKLFVADTAREIILECQTVMGAYGYSHEYDMERYVREAVLFPIAGGSSAVQKNNIANFMGLPRYDRR